MKKKIYDHRDFFSPSRECDSLGMTEKHEKFNPKVRVEARLSLFEIDNREALGADNNNVQLQGAVTNSLIIQSSISLTMFITVSSTHANDNTVNLLIKRTRIVWRASTDYYSLFSFSCFAQYFSFLSYLDRLEDDELWKLI